MSADSPPDPNTPAVPVVKVEVPTLRDHHRIASVVILSVVVGLILSVGAILAYQEFYIKPVLARASDQIDRAETMTQALINTLSSKNKTVSAAVQEQLKALNYTPLPAGK